MIKFHDDTVETRFIKYLLANTFTPLVGIAERDNFTQDGFTYVTKDSITNKKAGKFTYESPYVPILSYRNLTTSYQSNTRGYDSTTHYHLGQYLRMLRDIYDINLMPLYNCVDGKYARYLDITSDGASIVDDMSGFKILLVPVRFGKTYSIYYPGAVNISARFLFYGPKGLIIDNVKIEPNNFYEIGQCWSSPKVITAPKPAESADSTAYTTSLEKYFKLALKIPEDVSTSITVLEEDSNDCLLGDVIHGQQLPEEGHGPLSLTYISDGEIHPFSDKLIQYLSLNTISPVDEIGDNIARIQAAASSSRMRNLAGIRYTATYKKGVWDDSLRTYIYRLQQLIGTGKRVDNDKTVENNILSDSKVLLDALGYVDKEIEIYLMRGDS